LAALRTFGILVAQTIYGNAIDICEALHSAWATHAETYEANAYNIHRLSAKLQYRALPWNALRLVEDYNAVCNVILYTRLI
jgi:hypothetical protein